jgi:hypothetical protein
MGFLSSSGVTGETPLKSSTISGKTRLFPRGLSAAHLEQLLVSLVGMNSELRYQTFIPSHEAIAIQVEGFAHRFHAIFTFDASD